MRNLQQWLDYRIVQLSEIIRRATSHCFNLWIWKMHIRNYSLSFFCIFLRNFNLILREKVIKIFLRSRVWNVIQEFEKIPTSSDHISANIVWKPLKFGSKVQHDFFSIGFFLQLLKRHRTKVIAKMSWWPVWCSETLESKALIPNVMEPTQKKDRKNRSTP